jgi:hypothetical protein
LEKSDVCAEAVEGAGEVFSPAFHSAADVAEAAAGDGDAWMGVGNSIAISAGANGSGGFDQGVVGFHIFLRRGVTAGRNSLACILPFWLAIGGGGGLQRSSLWFRREQLKAKNAN